MKYIGYIRVSRDREGGLSTDQQRNEIAHWAATPGADREIVWLPPDADYSGKSLERPSMRRALQLLRSGEVDGLVVSKLDRLTRSVADLNRLIKDAQTSGWNIVALDVGVDLLTTNGKMVAHLIGAISEWYLDRVTEEWEKVRRYKINDEGAHWGAPPLGYVRGRSLNGRGDGVPGALIVDLRWSAVVQELFRRRAARGSDGSWAALARYLTAQGAPSYRHRAGQREPSSSPDAWSRGGVKAIVANRAYLGEARAGKLVKPHAHPALVDQQTWSAANRKGPTFGSLPDRRGGPLLGRGLLRCGTCGRGLVRSTSRSRHGHKYAFYRCVGPTCARRATISAPRIEQHLVTEALARSPEGSLLFDRFPASSAGASDGQRTTIVPSDIHAAQAFMRDVLGSVVVKATEVPPAGGRGPVAVSERVEVREPHASSCSRSSASSVAAAAACAPSDSSSPRVSTGTSGSWPDRGPGRGRSTGPRGRSA